MENMLSSSYTGPQGTYQGYNGKENNGGGMNKPPRHEVGEKHQHLPSSTRSGQRVQGSNGRINGERDDTGEGPPSQSMLSSTARNATDQQMQTLRGDPQGMMRTQRRSSSPAPVTQTKEATNSSFVGSKAFSGTHSAADQRPMGSNRRFSSSSGKPQADEHLRYSDPAFEARRSAMMNLSNKVRHSNSSYYNQQLDREQQMSKAAERTVERICNGEISIKSWVPVLRSSRQSKEDEQSRKTSAIPATTVSTGIPKLRSRKPINLDSNSSKAPDNEDFTPTSNVISPRKIVEDGMLSPSGTASQGKRTRRVSEEISASNSIPAYDKNGDKKQRLQRGRQYLKKQKERRKMEEERRKQEEAERVHRRTQALENLEAERRRRMLQRKQKTDRSDVQRNHESGRFKAVPKVDRQRLPTEKPTSFLPTQGPDVEGPQSGGVMSEQENLPSENNEHSQDHYQPRDDDQHVKERDENNRSKWFSLSANELDEGEVPVDNAFCPPQFSTGDDESGARYTEGMRTHVALEQQDGYSHEDSEVEQSNVFDVHLEPYPESVVCSTAPTAAHPSESSTRHIDEQASARRHVKEVDAPDGSLGGHSSSHDSPTFEEETGEEGRSPRTKMNEFFDSLAATSNKLANATTGVDHFTHKEKPLLQNHSIKSVDAKPAKTTDYEANREDARGNSESAHETLLTGPDIPVEGHIESAKSHSREHRPSKRSKSPRSQSKKVSSAPLYRNRRKKHTRARTPERVTQEPQPMRRKTRRFPGGTEEHLGVSESRYSVINLLIQNSRPFDAGKATEKDESQYHANKDKTQKPRGNIPQNLEYNKRKKMKRQPPSRTPRQSTRRTATIAEKSAEHFPSMHDKLIQQAIKQFGSEEEKSEVRERDTTPSTTTDNVHTRQVHTTETTDDSTWSSYTPVRQIAHQAQAEIEKRFPDTVNKRPPAHALQAQLMEGVNDLENMSNYDQQLQNLSHTREVALLKQETAAVDEYWRNHYQRAVWNAHVTSVNQQAEEEVDKRTKEMTDYLSEDYSKKVAELTQNIADAEYNVHEAKQRESSVQTDETQTGFQPRRTETDTSSKEMNSEGVRHEDFSLQESQLKNAEGYYALAISEAFRQYRADPSSLSHIQKQLLSEAASLSPMQFHRAVSETPPHPLQRNLETREALHESQHDSSYGSDFERFTDDHISVSEHTEYDQAQVQGSKEAQRVQYESANDSTIDTKIREKNPHDEGSVPEEHSFSTPSISDDRRDEASVAEEQSFNKSSRSDGRRGTSLQDETSIPEEESFNKSSRTTGRVDMNLQDETSVPEERSFNRVSRSPGREDMNLQDEASVPEDQSFSKVSRSPGRADMNLQDETSVPEEQSFDKSSRSDRRALASEAVDAVPRKQGREATVASELPSAVDESIPEQPLESSSKANLSTVESNMDQSYSYSFDSSMYDEDYRQRKHLQSSIGNATGVDEDINESIPGTITSNKGDRSIAGSVQTSENEDTSSRYSSDFVGSSEVSSDQQKEEEIVESGAKSEPLSESFESMVSSLGETASSDNEKQHKQSIFRQYWEELKKRKSHEEYIIRLQREALEDTYKKSLKELDDKIQKTKTDGDQLDYLKGKRKRWILWYHTSKADLQRKVAQINSRLYMDLTRFYQQLQPQTFNDHELSFQQEAFRPVLPQEMFDHWWPGSTAESLPVATTASLQASAEQISHTTLRVSDDSVQAREHSNIHMDEQRNQSKEARPKDEEYTPTETEYSDSFDTEDKVRYGEQSVKAEENTLNTELGDSEANDSVPEEITADDLSESSQEEEDGFTQTGQMLVSSKARDTSIDAETDNSVAYYSSTFEDADLNDTTPQVDNTVAPEKDDGFTQTGQVLVSSKARDTSIDAETDNSFADYSSAFEDADLNDTTPQVDNTAAPEDLSVETSKNSQAEKETDRGAEDQAGGPSAVSSVPEEVVDFDSTYDTYTDDETLTGGICAQESVILPSSLHDHPNVENAASTNIEGVDGGTSQQDITRPSSENDDIVKPVEDIDSMGDSLIESIVSETIWAHISANKSKATSKALPELPQEDGRKDSASPPKASPERTFGGNAMSPESGGSLSDSIEDSEEDLYDFSDVEPQVKLNATGEELRVDLPLRGVVETNNQSIQPRAPPLDIEEANDPAIALTAAAERAKHIDEQQRAWREDAADFVNRIKEALERHPELGDFYNHYTYTLDYSSKLHSSCSFSQTTRDASSSEFVKMARAGVPSEDFPGPLSWRLYIFVEQTKQDETASYCVDTQIKNRMLFEEANVYLLKRITQGCLRTWERENLSAGSIIDREKQALVDHLQYFSKGAGAPEDALSGHNASQRALVQARLDSRHWDPLWDSNGTEAKQQQLQVCGEVADSILDDLILDLSRELTGV